VTLPGLEGHISHKRFESPLIWQSHFEDKPSKQRDEYCYYSKRIQLKFKLIQFESNAGVNPPNRGRASLGPGRGAAVNGRCAALAANNAGDEARLAADAARPCATSIYRPVTFSCRNARTCIVAPV
jgi:hypothetical protein